MVFKLYQHVILTRKTFNIQVFCRQNELFGGALKTYEISIGANDLDLPYVNHTKRQEIENIVQLSVQQHSQ